MIFCPEAFLRLWKRKKNKVSSICSISSFYLMNGSFFFFPLALHFTVHMLKQHYPFPHALKTVSKRDPIIKGIKYTPYIYTLVHIYKYGYDNIWAWPRDVFCCKNTNPLFPSLVGVVLMLILKTIRKDKCNSADERGKSQWWRYYILRMSFPILAK